jgi:hypothetical protein
MMENEKLEVKVSKGTNENVRNSLPKKQLRLGYFVFGTLVSIKIVEYLISKLVKVGDWPYLAILALLSAWLIAYYYKHIRQFWHSRGKDNE